MNKFHIYIKSLRSREFTSIEKLAKILKIKHGMWRKIERGINPPPSKLILEKFCLLVKLKEYEKNQLYALAKKWTPHPYTNTIKHSLYHTGLEPRWVDAIIEENTPDYEHKYWNG